MLFRSETRVRNATRELRAYAGPLGVRVPQRQKEMSSKYARAGHFHDGPEWACESAGALEPHSEMIAIGCPTRISSAFAGIAASRAPGGGSALGLSERKACVFSCLG